MTRIKYHKTGKNYTSNYITNYEGKQFLVMIHFIEHEKCYRLSIIDNKDNARLSGYYSTPAIAKRTARVLLINKYNVRLDEEIRPRN